LSVDPLSDDYPWYTPYQFAGNKPIISIDIDGLEDYIVIGEEGQKAIITGPYRDLESAQSAAHRDPNQVSYLLPEISVSARKVDNGHSSLHGTGGYGLLTFYDSYQRGLYKSKIEANSANAVSKINATQIEGEAEKISRQVSKDRNILRNKTQQKLSPGGRAMSNAIDQPRVFEELAEKYKQPNPKDTYKDVAKAAGRSNSGLKHVIKLGKIGGPVTTALDGGLAIYNINEAAPEDRNRVIVEESAGFVGGAAGGTLGTALATGAATIVFGAIGVTPIGWVVILVGIGGGAVGGYYGSEAARSEANSHFKNDGNTSESENK
jgi:hypothetical protein